MPRPKSNSIQYNFDSLVEAFFEGNFSRITVSYVKELLFNAYYEVHSADGKTTDFDIAQNLGITPAQFRALRYRYDQTHQKDLKLEDILKCCPTKCSEDGKWVVLTINKTYLGAWAENYLKTQFDISCKYSPTRGKLEIALNDYVTLLVEACKSNPILESRANSELADFAEMNPAFRELMEEEDKTNFLFRMRDTSTLQNIFDHGLSIAEIISRIIPIFED